MVYSFAESPATADESQDICTDLAETIAKEHHTDRHTLCFYAHECEDRYSTIPEQKEVLKRDYITRQFLYQNPHMSLENLTIHRIDNIRTADTWFIRHSDDFYPWLNVTFDVCANITRYGYGQSENDVTLARYPGDDYVPDKVAIFEEDRYGVAKAVMGRHPPPGVQTGEFGIPPDEVNCNRDLELYMRDGGIPICVGSQAYERMQERGLDLDLVPRTEGYAEDLEDAFCLRYAKKIAEHDAVPRYTLCNYRHACVDYHTSRHEEMGVLEEDYPTRQFLYKNPHITLDDVHMTHHGGSLMATTWALPDWDSYPQLIVDFDGCINIVQYSYSQTEDDRILVTYPVDDYVPERVAQFEEAVHGLAAKIMGQD